MVAERGSGVLKVFFLLLFCFFKEETFFFFNADENVTVGKENSDGAREREENFLEPCPCAHHKVY